MKLLSSGLALVVLAAALAIAPAQQAKADGGVTAVVVGAYLIGDYVVGRKCRIHLWPFNIVTKVAHAVHGRHICRYRSH